MKKPARAPLCCPFIGDITITIQDIPEISDPIVDSFLLRLFVGQHAPVAEKERATCEFAQHLQRCDVIGYSIEFRPWQDVLGTNMTQSIHRALVRIGKDMGNSPGVTDDLNPRVRNHGGSQHQGRTSKDQ